VGSGALRRGWHRSRSCRLDSVDFTTDPTGRFIDRVADDHGAFVSIDIGVPVGGQKIITLDALTSRRDAVAAWRWRSPGLRDHRSERVRD